MSERLQNILWMAEELDFEMKNDLKIEAKSVVNQFLELTANPQLSHWVY